MSISSLINSPSYGQTYEILSLKAGTSAIAGVADGTIAPNIVFPLRNAADTETLSLSLPIGVYSIQMLSALNGTVNATVIPVSQQLLIDVATGSVLASGRSICATTATNTTYGDTIILSDTVVLHLDVPRNITFKVMSNPITNAVNIMGVSAFGPAGSQTVTTPRLTAVKIL